MRMMGLALAIFLLLGTSQGFFIHTGRPVSKPQVIMMGGRKATPLGRASTLPFKEARVEAIQDQLDKSLLIFSVPSAGLSVAQLSKLRTKMPASTKVMVVKNTLMNRACEETKWETVSELLTKENMWFFVGEDIRDTVDGYGDWIKELGPTYKEEFAIKGGVSEGNLLDAKGVDAMSKLPTKAELITKIAIGIKNAGAQGLVTKLGNVKGGPKSIAVRLKKASGNKLAVAIKLALTDPEKNPNA